MDDDDSTEALLAKLIEGERIIDDAIINLYDDERARGLSAIVGGILNINNNSDNPPFECDLPSALLGNKRSLPLRWTAEQQPSSKVTTSAALNLAVKNEISPDSFSLDNFNSCCWRSHNNYSGAMCEVPPSLWQHLTHQRSHNITKIPGGLQLWQRRGRDGCGVMCEAPPSL
jgi:hypothetical protein